VKSWRDVAARITDHHYGPALLAARTAIGFEERPRALAFAYRCGDEDHGPRYRATALYERLKSV
jgi:hypothetical protein